MPSQDWLIAPRSVRIFSLLGVITLITGAFVLPMFVFRNSEIVTTLATTPAFKALSGLIGVIGAPAGICLLAGMLWFWAKLDASPKFHKTLWFISFLIPFFGWAAYSLVVYRSQAKQQLAESSPS